MKPLTQGRPLCHVPIRINQEDIDKMNYWLNEAGVANPASENAICYAIQRLVLPKTKVLLRQKSGKVRVALGPTSIELPSDLASWYREALMGADVSPIRGFLTLPRTLLSSEARKLVASSQPAAERTKPKAPKRSLTVEAA
tara:strand:- start:19934 stop:20356 length:423 start_codon:yes stop_codon:yes gene_type:complete